MSVLIKDMEMPKCCLECPFENSPEFDSYCIAVGNEFIGKWEDLGTYKPNWCPIEEPKTGWIPVSERLPEIGQKVLASTKKTVFTQVYKGICSEPNVWHWNHNSIKVITAWQPLPEPYREDGEA